MKIRRPVRAAPPSSPARADQRQHKGIAQLVNRARTKPVGFAGSLWRHVGRTRLCALAAHTSGKTSLLARLQLRLIAVNDRALRDAVWPCQRKGNQAGARPRIEENALVVATSFSGPKTGFSGFWHLRSISDLSHLINECRAIPRLLH
jgi:hypothetical protein